jgi:hypothetical protein
MPLVKGIADANFSGDFANSRLPEAVKKGTIVFRGKFTPEFEYMEEFL